jgi:hypothetical protein
MAKKTIVKPVSITPMTHKWLQEECFSIFDLKDSGYTYDRLAKMFDCSLSTIHRIIERERMLIAIVGEGRYAKSREMVRILRLDVATFGVLVRSGFTSVEDIISFLHEGKFQGRSYIRNLGPARLQLMADRLKELGLWTFEEKPKIPIPLNLPDPNDWENCLVYWENRCAICGASPSPESALVQDHWVPRSLNICPGTIVTNIIPLCSLCNSTKLNIDGYFWMVEKLGKSFADQKMREILDYFDWWRSQGRE